VTAAKGHYVPSMLAATETEAAAVCADCGALVADTAAHDKFHDAVRKSRA
jgi:hypothetical protein